jgi:hypothetical protein
MGVGYRRARLSALAGGGAFGCGAGFGAGAGSSFASAERSGSRRGARGNLSVSMARRIAAVTAASSSSVTVIVDTVSASLTAPQRQRLYAPGIIELAGRWRLSHSETSGKFLLTISHHILELAGRGAPQLEWIERSGFDVGSSSVASEPYSWRGSGFNSCRRASADLSRQNF